RRFVEMWGFCPDVVAAASAKAGLAAARDRVVDNADIRRMVRHFAAHPDDAGTQLVQLKDGRTLEEFSAPVVSQTGVRYGRLWISRDVTQYKQTERELRALQ